ncbi:MAG: sugar phosphate isomerase/epimerase [Spartobacteria bacterium]|nr:sugar phosphate isomerase/epimerase [Spartobacteria bacterium]
MHFALTTRWNAGRHSSGEAIIEEILDLGFDRVELGYDLRIDLVPGVQAMVRNGCITVDTVHNFCPVPVGAPRGHPEIYTLSDPDRRTRASAVEHTGRTIRFAAEIGAKAVVLHAGNVDMPRMTDRLVALYQEGKLYTPAYERTKLKLQMKREKKVRKQLPHLYASLEQLLPVLEECRVRLGIENLPTWEAIPTEVEIEQLLKHFNSDYLGYWHDIGHAQVRENLGMINHERWLERLQPWLVGMHIHDVQPPVFDHLMPPNGKVDFDRLKRFAQLDIFRVFEPITMEEPNAIARAKQFIEDKWSH